MSESSPHFLFDPDSRGSLYFKFANGYPITKGNIDRVLKNDEQAHEDPRMLQILVASQLGTLPTRRGRPNRKHDFLYQGKLLLAEDAIKERAQKIRKAQKELPEDTVHS